MHPHIEPRHERVAERIVRFPIDIRPAAPYSGRRRGQRTGCSIEGTRHVRGGGGQAAQCARAARRMEAIRRCRMPEVRERRQRLRAHLPVLRSVLPGSQGAALAVRGGCGGSLRLGPPTVPQRRVTTPYRGIDPSSSTPTPSPSSATSPSASSRSSDGPHGPSGPLALGLGLGLSLLVEDVQEALGRDLRAGGIAQDAAGLCLHRFPHVTRAVRL